MRVQKCKRFHGSGGWVQIMRLHKSQPKHKNASSERLDSFFKKSVDTRRSVLLRRGGPDGTGSSSLCWYRNASIFLVREAGSRVRASTNHSQNTRIRARINSIHFLVSLWTSCRPSRCGEMLRRPLGRRLYEGTETWHFHYESSCFSRYKS